MAARNAHWTRSLNLPSRAKTRTQDQYSVYWVPLDPMPDWVLPRRRAIGARLRAAREDAGLTQLELAELIGRDNRTIHRWEYAYRIPSLEDLLLLAAALDTPLADLVR